MPALTKLTNMTTFKSVNAENERVIFNCSGHDSRCCDESVELCSDSSFSDCGPDYEFWFSLRGYPQTIWRAIQYWYRFRRVYYTEFSLTRKDLEHMRDKINEELARPLPNKK